MKNIDILQSNLKIVEK